MSFQGKVALITGGTSGIGKATALLLARQGAKVVIAGRREEQGSAVVRQIQEEGGDAIFVKTDVANENDVKHLVAETVKQYGRVDIAFNNAGVEHAGPVTDFTVDAYRHVFDINVLGVFVSMKYEIEQMLQQGGGVIINTSSILGHVAMPGASIYNASKHAVEGATKTAALEYAQQNIRINAIAPAATATDMIDRFAGKEGAESRAQLAALHPMNRLATAEEMAAAVAYLASDAASFTTGISLPVDGGFLAK
ncbi:glucose 1-dehydrogenase [Blastopirellula marina]|uniref:Short chain dehydrogenase n=1 Tax=Blastopirellula marina TaxID=124 RepID=A0A2S8FNP9_9BACT|nr:glucose 1-dehydrogenase [Blastopirellula marina]PQO33809.1 short chain dehydrogenase [Blastopirellula marina]PTL43596.1 3-oxoacyl-ACP reductase [Blastopirellula marina]